ncbi:hypothetical protein [Heliorestis convoluta]|uniref:Uncharacterized protein n=1 Tax=Heliorestis convoluta TaxID=356322 RepID=A0A5Q2N656_9FIRM|nr:hypothetical protein [Heliorestis convoluta]QGG47740.1 hypothetical protein FTV88_1641 [Heliorestis convoluta]
MCDCRYPPYPCHPPKHVKKPVKREPIEECHRLMREHEMRTEQMVRAMMDQYGQHMYRRLYKHMQMMFLCMKEDVKPTLPTKPCPPPALSPIPERKPLPPKAPKKPCPPPKIPAVPKPVAPIEEPPKPIKKPAPPPKKPIEKPLPPKPIEKPLPPKPIDVPPPPVKKPVEKPLPPKPIEKPIEKPLKPMPPRPVKKPDLIPFSEPLPERDGENEPNKQ